MRGYAGRTKAGGVVSFLHEDRVKRLVVAVSEAATNASTMFYSGDQLPKQYEGKPMMELIAELGRSAFVQPLEGQVAQLGPKDYHGEPPLPTGTPRILLVSTRALDS